MASVTVLWAALCYTSLDKWLLRSRFLKEHRLLCSDPRVRRSLQRSSSRAIASTDFLRFPIQLSEARDQH
jgi:hypothetical protein